MYPRPSNHQGKMQECMLWTEEIVYSLQASKLKFANKLQVWCVCEWILSFFSGMVYFWIQFCTYWKDCVVFSNKRSPGWDIHGWCYGDHQVGKSLGDMKLPGWEIHGWWYGIARLGNPWGMLERSPGWEIHGWCYGIARMGNPWAMIGRSSGWEIHGR